MLRVQPKCFVVELQRKNIEMAYENKHGWRCPSEEDTYPRARRHVGFRTNSEDPFVESNVDQGYQSGRFGNNHFAYKSVDQEAEAFIQYEHRRMEYARLMSSRTPSSS
ncbi:hypothetical protein VNO78_10781 [Psophocarpus tetragonolobus]|uniref:Uncharacterized protein n=1 Tax=Psophocarpus tetragonolobus TaxID=3891 RepID=A0AAN9XMU6_PSOTE